MFTEEKSAFPHTAFFFFFKDKYKRYQIKRLVEMDFFLFSAVRCGGELNPKACLGEVNKSPPSWPSEPSTR